MNANRQNTSFSFRHLRFLGSDSYRASWYGNVNINDGSCGGVPSIKVVFAKCASLLPGKDLVLRSASLPVSILPFVPIGSIWSNGRNVGDDKEMTRLTLMGLTRPEGLSGLVPAGGFVEGQNTSARCLPFSRFPFHTDHTESWLTVARTPDGIAVVVPSLELVRFYFGASGSVVSRLLSGASAMENLWVSARHTVRTDVANIELAQGLNGAAAATVARIALDKAAKAAAQLVVRSTMTAHVNQEKVYPKCFLPFSGSTDLTVLGRWIHEGTFKLFLAERIISCTHPFPFSELFYRRNASTLEISPAQLKDQQPRTDLEASDSKKIDSVVDSSNPARSKPRRIAISGYAGAEPFPDLISKKIRNVKRPKTLFSGRKGDSVHLDPEPLGAGDESWRPGVRGIEPIVSTSLLEKDRTDHPTFFFLETMERAKRDGLPIRLIRFRKGHPASDTSPEYDESGVVIVTIGEDSSYALECPNLYVSRIENLQSPNQSILVFSRDLAEEPDRIVIGITRLDFKPANELRWIVRRLGEFFNLRSDVPLTRPWVTQISSEEFLRQQGVLEKIFSACDCSVPNESGMIPLPSGRQVTT